MERLVGACEDFGFYSEGDGKTWDFFEQRSNII